MTAETLIITSTQFIVVFFAIVVVTTPSIVSLLGNSRKELYEIGMERSKIGSDYFQWEGYIANRVEKNNELKDLLHKKMRTFIILVGASILFGIILPGIFEIYGIPKWLSLFDEKLMYLLILFLIVGACFLWVYIIVTELSDFERVKEKDSFDVRGQERWKARLGLMLGKSIPNDREGWAWEPMRQGLLIMDNKHQRKIEVPNISKNVMLVQDLELLGKIPTKDGSELDLGWRLSSYSLAGPHDERTAHIGSQRGRLHREGDFFQTKEELLPIADEWVEWAIEEWQKLEGKNDE